MSKTEKKAAVPDVRGRAAVADRPTLAALLGPPILLAGESSESRQTLANSLREAIRPRDALEEIYLDDLIEAQWDKLRWRRAKIDLLRSSAEKGVQALIAPLVEEDPYSLQGLYKQVQDLVKKWSRRDPATLRQVEKMLQEAGHDDGAIMAQTLLVLIDKVEAIEKLISRAETRYNAAIRDINDHRVTLQQRQHEAITDADFKELHREENAA
jgi:hypothetical protein